MKKTFTFIIVSLFLIHNSISQNVIMWTDTFVSNVGATTQQVNDWNNFRAQLLSSYCYYKMKISGTYDTAGIICTDPAIVLSYANALRNVSSYTSPLTNGHVWSLCNRYSGEVWIDPPSECSGANCPGPNAYIIRPAIGGTNPNWGGVNTNTCNGPNQRMTLTFYYSSTSIIPTAPVTINGLTSGCIGDTLVFSIDTVPNADFYTWSNTGSSQIISGQGSTSIQFVVDAGLDTIRVIANNNCVGSSAPTSLAFTGYTLPVVSLSSANACDNLSANAIGTGTPPGGVYSGTYITGGDFDGISSGPGTFPFTYTYTDVNGCTNHASDSVYVYAAPTATFTYTGLDTVCINYPSITLSGGSPSGGVYSGFGVSSGVFDPSVAGIGTHIISYTYTDANNCDGSDDVEITVLGCVNIEEIQDNRDVEIYPNPFDNITTIDISGNLIENGTYTLIDLTGRIIRQTNFTGNKVMILKENLSSGIYQLIISENDHLILSGKLIVK